MTPSSVGGIELRLKNYRESFYFMSLETWERIHARQWTAIHITEIVIVRVEKHPAKEGIN